MSQSIDGHSVIQWLGWADEDYKSARLLFLNNSIVQGCVFSNTAIEKYLKTIFIASGSKPPRGHNVFQIFQELSKIQKLPPLNESYLKLLFKVYKMRYPDDLEIGYNLSLARVKMLTELDYSVYELRKGFQFVNKERLTRFEELLSKGDEKLLKENCYLGSTIRKDLFSGGSLCYEIRVLAQGIIEANYYTKSLDDDLNFDEEGLKPSSKPV